MQHLGVILKPRCWKCSVPLMTLQLWKFGCPFQLSGFGTRRSPVLYIVCIEIHIYIYAYIYMHINYTFFIDVCMYIYIIRVFTYNVHIYIQYIFMLLSSCDSCVPHMSHHQAASLFASSSLRRGHEWLAHLRRRKPRING